MAAGWWCHDYLARNSQFWAADFTFPWRAAGHLLAGRDPYQQMPRVATYAASGPFPYPLTSALLALPFARLSPPAAGGAFIGLSLGLLAFGLTRTTLWPLVAFLSAPAVLTLTTTQWSPLIMASILLPGFGWVGAAKPNLGLVAFVLRPRWSTIIGGVVLLAIAFVLVPRWPLEWLEHLRLATLTYRPVVVWPLGAVALLSALRWRTFEGRALLAMLLVPVAPFHYDHLLLWLIPRSWRESLVLSACSWASVIAVLATTPHDLTRDARLVQGLIVVGMYVPATIIVLRRPNEGAVSARVERIAARLPTSLRGQPAPLVVADGSSGDPPHA